MVASHACYHKAALVWWEAITDHCWGRGFCCRAVAFAAECCFSCVIQGEAHSFGPPVHTLSISLDALNISLTSAGCYFLTVNPFRLAHVTLEHVWRVLGCSGWFLCTDCICDKWVGHQTKECWKITSACEVHEMLERQDHAGLGVGALHSTSLLVLFFFSFFPRAINLARSLEVRVLQEGMIILTWNAGFSEARIDSEDYCILRHFRKNYKSVIRVQKEFQSKTKLLRR